MRKLFVLGALLLAACGGETPIEEKPVKENAVLKSQLPDLTGKFVWDMVEAKSTLEFKGKHAGQDFTGRFNDFQSAIKFDPDFPEQGQIEAIIDLAPFSTGDDDRDSNLPLKDWFDTTNHPTARWKSKLILKQDDGKYKALGMLTIKDLTQPVDLIFDLNIDGDTATAYSVVKLSRRDFRLGLGPDFATEEWAGFDVEVLVNITATR